MRCRETLPGTFGKEVPGKISKETFLLDLELSGFETQAILAGKHGVGAETKDEKHQNPSLEQKDAIQERARG